MIRKLLMKMPLLLMVLFTYTATSKLIHNNSFRVILRRSPLLFHAAGFLATAIPAAELTVVVLLLPGVTRRLGLYTSLVLLCIFTLYISYLILVSDHPPCPCGGIISRMSWAGHFYFNVVMILLTALSLRYYKGRPP